MRRKGWICLALMLICCSAAHGEEQMYFRVVSRDESAVAQVEKYQVRDAILPLLPDDFEALSQMLPKIHGEVNKIAPCQADIRPWAPEGMETRSTLYITIGEGQGPNWWGILYGDGMALFSEDTEGEEVTFTWPVIGWLLKWLGIQ